MNIKNQSVVDIEDDKYHYRFIFRNKMLLITIISYLDHISHLYHTSFNERGTGLWDISKRPEDLTDSLINEMKMKAANSLGWDLLEPERGEPSSSIQI